MISGYIYVTAIQIKKSYKGFEKISNNFIENIFINYNDYNNKNECDYLKWKYEKIINITNNYDKYYNNVLIEAKRFLIQLID